MTDADGRIVQGRVVRGDVVHGNAVPGDVLPGDVVRVDEPVQRISSARMSHSEDVDGRMKRYAFSMAVRTACVAAFIVAFPHWSAWLFVPGAVFLPYVSVILANAGRERAPVAVPAPVHLPSADRMIGGTVRGDAA